MSFSSDSVDLDGIISYVVYFITLNPMPAIFDAAREYELKLCLAVHPTHTQTNATCEEYIQVWLTLVCGPCREQCHKWLTAKDIMKLLLKMVTVDM